MHIFASPIICWSRDLVVHGLSACLCYFIVAIGASFMSDRLFLRSRRIGALHASQLNAASAIDIRMEGIYIYVYMYI